MMITRIFHWAFRIPMLPAGHTRDCRAGTDDIRPGDLIDEIPSVPGMPPFRVVAVKSCRCDYHKLRPPTFYEAVMGISHT